MARGLNLEGVIRETCDKIENYYEKMENDFSAWDAGRLSSNIGVPNIDGYLRDVEKSLRSLESKMNRENMSLQDSYSWGDYAYGISSCLQAASNFGYQFQVRLRKEVDGRKYPLTALAMSYYY
jgi:hypothetical protein